MKDAEDFCVTQLLPALEKLDKKLMSCFGEDFGRSGDLTVVWPLQFMGNMTRRTPFVLELRNVPFRQQEQILFYLVDRLPRFQAARWTRAAMVSTWPSRQRSDTERASSR